MAAVAVVVEMPQASFRLGRRMLLLCQGEAASGHVAVDGGRLGGHRGRGVAGVQESPDAAGEVAFEAAQRLAAALAFGLLAGEVVGGLGVESALGDGEAVERAVELAVAAFVEAVSDGAAGGG